MPTLCYGIAINTFLLLLIKKILWNCFRGTLSFFMQQCFCQDTMFVEIETIKTEKCGYSTHDLDTLKGNPSIF